MHRVGGFNSSRIERQQGKGLGTYFPIVLSFVIAFLLMLMPLPLWAEWLKPTWVVLVLLYWTLVLPQRIGIGVAWIVGLLLDGVMNLPFGENAFALVLLSYFLIYYNKNIRTMFFLPKMTVIFVLLMLYQLTLLFFEGAKGHTWFALWICLLHAVVGLLIWPWLAIILFEYQRRYLPLVEN